MLGSFLGHIFSMQISRIQSASLFWGSPVCGFQDRLPEVEEAQCPTYNFLESTDMNCEEGLGI